MDINYVLAAHGVVGKRGGSESIAYESVTNLTAKSIQNGTKILVTWDNPTQTEYVKTEVFMSETDLTNMDYATCLSSYTKVIDGTLSSYEKVATYGITYYFKAFVTYFTFGENKVSKGLTTFATANDITPPKPITSFSAVGGNESIYLSWANPNDADFNKVKILYKIDSYPTSTTDGEVAYEGSGTSTTIGSLVNGKDYYFRAFTFDNFFNVNDDISQQTISTPTSFKIYGVKIDTTNSNPATALSYIDDSVNFNAASGNNGSFLYGSWEDKFPFNQIKPCLFKDGVVNYYLNPNDYTKKIDGGNADVTSGNDGDVMVEFPKIYWKFETIGTELFIRYSNIKIDSGYMCLAHTRGSEEKELVYLSAYLGNESSSKIRSLSGKNPTANKSLTDARTLSKANGVGYEQHAYYQLVMLQVLFIVMFKSRNSQSALGRGFVDGNSLPKTTGGTNSKGLFYGENTGKLQNKFCGIEDFWGNVYYWIDGMITDASRNLLIGSNNFNNSGSGYINYGQASSTDVVGYMSSVQGLTQTAFITKSTSASSTTYYTDYSVLYSSRTPVFGGYYIDNNAAGAFQLILDFQASSVNPNIGSRLMYL